MILLGLFTAMLTVSVRWPVDAMTADNSPGLDFVPRPDPAKAYLSLIHYKPNNGTDVRKWTSKIDEAFQQYRRKAPGAENRISCSPDLPPFGGHSCDVPVFDFHPCTSANLYNYDRAGPCVFLKLDKVLNWTPDPYNTTDDLPANMPEDLKQYINIVSGRKGANTVWVSCEGKDSTDLVSMGPIQYIPRRGFPAHYFPFSDQQGYLSPLVAVLFEKPTKGVVINVECTAWARNIARDGDNTDNDWGGSVRFELYIDE